MFKREFMKFETIVALATPPGNSGVAVIRISGEKSKEILQKLIRENLDFEPRKMYLKNVHIKNYTDRCLVVFFAAPFSYTGEDVAEIQAHGGYFLAQSIVDEAISLGCKPASPGEFSRRAFLNGKMSLDQAEGIMDLINAETDMQASMGSNLLQGELKNGIIKYQNILTEILAEIEAKLDYPEYEFSASETSNILDKLKSVKTALSALVSDSTGQVIKNGIRVAIVGAPNVGKSSLLNAMTKSNKAIVTNIAGTTRDVIEAEYVYNGIIFRLFDTAGIHIATDEVEKIGIDRAIKTIDECDIVLKLSEPNKPCTVETNKPFIDVLNKTDLIDNSEQIGAPVKNSLFNGEFQSGATIQISALKGQNIDELKELIFKLTVGNKIDANKFYLTNARHIDCVKTAILHIENAIKIFNNSTMDIISSEIKLAWLSLGEISGTTSNEEIVDKIFSKFCLGK